MDVTGRALAETVWKSGNMTVESQPAFLLHKKHTCRPLSLK